MIDMSKKYATRDGKSVRILCVDGVEPYPVIGVHERGSVLKWTINGCFYDDNSPCELDLVEVCPYSSFKINDPVMARGLDPERWVRRHFAGVSQKGYPLTFAYGRTSFTSIGTECWSEIRRPTKKESGDEKV